MLKKTVESCSDKDISEMLMDAKADIEMNGTYEINGSDFYALLARLEESEKLNDAFINGFKDAVDYRLKTWRKSKGEHLE